MKFPLSWLKLHLDCNESAETIGQRLTMLGLELENLDDPTKRLSGFIVAHILETARHPNADRLQVCKVSTGKEVLQIVCGAPNARPGLKVVLATPGTVIPDTKTALKAGMVRGVESQGMMCSSRELLLGDNHDGIIELPENSPIGKALVEIWPIDPVFEIAVTPNRSDCLGVRGIARDLAASGLGKLKDLPTQSVPSTFPCEISLDRKFPADSEDACPIFVGRVIRNVKNGKSPEWLQNWLNVVGQKSVSTLVDITNFVMFDLNRPLHVFDKAKLQKNLTLRFANNGEKFSAINDRNYDLSDGQTVIADASGILALGGVMGGATSAVTYETKDVFLEVALFEPARTATTGRSLSLESDARYRFERGLDPSFLMDAVEIATRLILDLCGGEASELVISGQIPPKSSIPFHPEQTSRLGGVSIDESEQARILRALGAEVIEGNKCWQVIVPGWRGDISAEHDLVEEILRIFGYDHIPETPFALSAMTGPILTMAQRRTGWLRRELACRGLTEAVTFSFLSKRHAIMFGGGQKELELANPMSTDLDVMRPSLLPNLLSAAIRNIDRGIKDIGLFETGPQFAGDQIGQQKNMATGIRSGRAGDRHWSHSTRLVDAFDAKADALAAIAAIGGPAESLQIVTKTPPWYHPGRSGTLKLGNNIIGHFGEIHPEILAVFDIKTATVGFELFLENIPTPKSGNSKARQPLRLSPFQAIERDFAFLLDEKIAASAILRAVRSADKQHIVEVNLFDIYQGSNLPEGKKSLAIQAVIQPTQNTLTDAEIETISAKIIEAAAKVGAVLRN